jgi:hypothetical protein
MRDCRLNQARLGCLISWGRFDEHNRSESAAEADARAIASDWAVVVQDICYAIEQFDA